MLKYWKIWWKNRNKINYKRRKERRRRKIINKFYNKEINKDKLLNEIKKMTIKNVSMLLNESLNIINNEKNNNEVK